MNRKGRRRGEENGDECKADDKGNEIGEEFIIRKRRKMEESTGKRKKIESIR